MCRETVKDDEHGNKIEKLSMKKKGVGSELRAERLVNTDVDMQLFGHAEQERQMNKQKKRRIRGREEEVCFFIVYRSFHQYYITTLNCILERITSEITIISVVLRQIFNLFFLFFLIFSNLSMIDTSKAE